MGWENCPTPLSSGTIPIEVRDTEVPLDFTASDLCLSVTKPIVSGHVLSITVGGTSSCFLPAPPLGSTPRHPALPVAKRAGKPALACARRAGHGRCRIGRRRARAILPIARLGHRPGWPITCRHPLQRQRQPLQQVDHRAVAPLAHGRQSRRQAVNRALALACQRAGLAVRSFHDLRHTHGTLLIAAGIDVKTVSERLGHASVAITLGLYVHPDEQAHQAAASAIGAALTGSGDTMVTKLRLVGENTA